MAKPQTLDKPEPTPEPAGADGTTDPATSVATGGSTATTSGRFASFGPLLLVRAAHPRQAVLTALALAVAAALAGRASREVLLVLATVFIGQTILGWHNDIVDADRDRAHDTPGKPVADGRLDPGTVWFAIACAVLLVVPLSIGSGVTAGCFYLGSLVVGLLGNVVLREGLLSWVSWAVSFALYPAFLSYGGWGGEHVGSPPEVAMVVLAALLGVGVHVLRSLWGLVPDHEDGWTYLPLRLGLKLGASRLLTVAGAWCVLVLAAMAYVGASAGLSR